MELTNKEVDLQRNKLSQIPINLKSDYLPLLHAQAAELRKDTILLDEYLTKGLFGLQPELSTLITSLDINQMNKLKEAIGHEADVEKRKGMEDSLKAMEEECHDKTKTFTQVFLDIIRTIHQQNNLLASTQLYEQCQKAYETKEQELSNHLQYIENALVPQLNAIKKELDTVDTSLMEKLKTSPFKDAIDVLPQKLEISEAAASQPELLAATLGYDATLSVLKGLWKMTEVTDYFDEHLDLQNQVTELEQKIEAEKVIYDSLKANLESIKNLYTVYSISRYFLNLSKSISCDLNQFYEQLKTETQALDAFLIHAQNLLVYLKKLNIIRK